MDQTDIKKKIYSRIDELPTLPTVVPRLLAMLQRDSTSAGDVTEVVSGDQALASKVLKVANSAYYGFSREIKSLESAVALLGFNMVRSLALSIGVIRTIHGGTPVEEYSQEGMWVHSLAVATTLRELNSRFGGKQERDYLFIVGLLHDIGKVVIIHFFVDLFKRVIEEAREHRGGDFLAAERSVIGSDHGEIGAMLLSRWRFPGEICDPIAAHHRTGAAEGVDAFDLAMLRVADALPKQVGLGGAGFPTPDSILAADLELLSISGDDIEDMRRYLIGFEDEIRAFSSAVS